MSFWSVLFVFFSGNEHTIVELLLVRFFVAIYMVISARM